MKNDDSGTQRFDESGVKVSDHWPNKVEWSCFSSRPDSGRVDGSGLPAFWMGCGVRSNFLCCGPDLQSCPRRVNADEIDSQGREISPSINTGGVNWTLKIES